MWVNFVYCIKTLNSTNLIGNGHFINDSQFVVLLLLMSNYGSLSKQRNAGVVSDVSFEIVESRTASLDLGGIRWYCYPI